MKDKNERSYLGRAGCILTFEEIIVQGYM